MPLVFVSYSRQDREIAGKLVERLRGAAPEGLDIVIDEPVDGELAYAPNDTYRLPYVGKRLRNANAVVCVLTRSYAESDPCWLELSAALMMDKVVPISLDPGLSPAGISSMVSHKDVMAIAPAWFSKEPGEVEAFETAKFETFVRALKAESETHHPFSDWAPAEPKQVRELAKSLGEALRPRRFRRSDLVWSPGSIAEVQKERFFAAIDSLSIATGEGPWDVARRKALKAMAAEPTLARVRAEALMGLIGELTAPSDGSLPVTAPEPWEFVGDFALPIDRDISRFAYTRAGKIPNELRKMFQVLRPGRSKRGVMFALGAVLGGAVGVVLTYSGQMLFGAPSGRFSASLPPDAAPASAPESTELADSALEDSGTQQPEATTQRAIAPTGSPAGPVGQTPAPAPSGAAERAGSSAQTTTGPDQQLTFAVTARGLEASVRTEMARRGLDDSRWKDIYGEVISVNLDTLCGPERWEASERLGKKPLDVIDSATLLTWPTQTDFEKSSRLRECPVFKIPT
jgi:TIR domain